MKRAGIIYLQVDGEFLDVKGNYTYSLGTPKRETIIGADAPHGYTEKVQAPFIEGEITDSRDLDLQKLFTCSGVTVTLTMGNGKIFVLREAWFSGEGTGQTEEANIPVRFDGMSGEIITN